MGKTTAKSPYHYKFPESRHGKVSRRFYEEEYLQQDVPEGLGIDSVRSRKPSNTKRKFGYRRRPHNPRLKVFNGVAGRI